MEFEYRVLESGWAEARLGHEGGSVDLSASYLSDALGDLVETVALVVEGVPSARCSWLEEPGEFRWRFLRHDDDVDLDVLWLTDWDMRDDEGHPVFHARVPAARLGRVVLAEAQRVLDTFGLNEYRRRWIEHEFPLPALQHLRLAIQRAKLGPSERG